MTIEIYQCLLLWTSGLLAGLLFRREGKTGPMGPMGPPGMMGEPGNDGADGLDCLCRTGIIEYRGKGPTVKVKNPVVCSVFCKRCGALIECESTADLPILCDACYGYECRRAFKEINNP